MTHATTRFAGAAQSTMAAGPLFVLGAAISVLIYDPAAAIPVDLNLTGRNIAAMLVGVPVGLVIVTVVGALFAVLPNLAGTAAMIWLGDRNPGAQLPVFWALAGATAFAAPIAALDEVSLVGLVPFVFTGACCALICRQGVSFGPPPSWSSCRKVQG